MYYKLFGYKILKEQYEILFKNNNKNYSLNLIEEKISDKDLFEVDIIEDESSKLSKLFEMDRLQKLNDNSDENSIIKYLKENEKWHVNLLNFGVGITILTTQFI